MMTKQPSFKATVIGIAGGVVQVKYNEERISFPKEFFSKLPEVGDELYVALQTHADSKKHHENLAKSILNTIFGKKT